MCNYYRLIITIACSLFISHHSCPLRSLLVSWDGYKQGKQFEKLGVFLRTDNSVLTRTPAWVTRQSRCTAFFTLSCSCLPLKQYKSVSLKSLACCFIRPNTSTLTVLGINSRHTEAQIRSVWPHIITLWMLTSTKTNVRWKHWGRKPWTAPSVSRDDDSSGSWRHNQSWYPTNFVS